MACHECEPARKAIVGLRAQIRRLRQKKTKRMFLPKQYRVAQPRAGTVRPAPPPDLSWAQATAAPIEAARPSAPAGRNNPDQQPDFLDWNVSRNGSFRDMTRLRLRVGELTTQMTGIFMVTGFRWSPMLGAWMPDMEQITLQQQPLDTPLSSTAPIGTYTERVRPVTQMQPENTAQGDMLRIAYRRAPGGWVPAFFCDVAPPEPPSRPV